MIVAVADTHAVIWYLYGDRRLTERARDFLRSASESGQKVAVSAITFAEIVYLQERGRIPNHALDDLLVAAADIKSVLITIPFDEHIAREFAGVSRQQIPELPDRIVAATAVHLGVPVISRDHAIQASSVETIW